MSSWKQKWAKFKKDLPHRSGDFSKRNWGSQLHSVCSYSGKLKPSIAHHLIKTFTNKGDLLAEPFSGSGTISLEAALNQRKCISFDISDMASIITCAKVRRSDESEIGDILENLEKYINNFIQLNKKNKIDVSFGFNGPISSYFHKKTLIEVLAAKEFFSKTKDLSNPSWCLVFSSMLHILHGNRPYALSRNSHPLTPYAPTGDFEYRNLMDRIRKKCLKSINAQQSVELIEGKVFCHDILKTWPINSKVDAIITSPPFVSSTKFYMTNWMRMWFSGWDAKDFNQKPSKFIEKLQVKDINVYKQIFNHFRNNLKKDGLIVFHVGKNNKVDMGEVLSKMKFDGVKLIDCFSEDTSSLEKHGFKDKGSTVEHQYLIFKCI